MAESDDGYVSGTAYASSDDDDIFEIQRMHSRRAPSSNPGSDRGFEIVWDADLLYRARLLLYVNCFLIIASFLDA